MTRSGRKARFDALTVLGCAVCRRDLGVYSRPQIHHLRGHPWSYTGKRADDQYTIGLCAVHHTDGGHGVAYHAGAQIWEQNHGTQAQILAWTDARIAK